MNTSKKDKVKKENILIKHPIIPVSLKQITKMNNNFHIINNKPTFIVEVMGRIKNVSSTLKPKFTQHKIIISNAVGIDIAVVYIVANPDLQQFVPFEYKLNYI